MPNRLAETMPSSFMALLREELTPRPGRLAAVLRIAGNCAVVVWIAMKYQIPLPAYMAYLVFVCSQEESTSTLLTGLVGVLATTIAIALSLLFYMLDASEPALRLGLMALSTFVGIFLMRTTKLGPLAFLASFVLVLSQTLIDGIPSLEALTRLILWLWVVVVVPSTVTALVNLLIGDNPATLARRTALRLLADLAKALRGGSLMPLSRQQAEAVKLVELRHRAGLFNSDLRGRAGSDTRLIETLVELLALYRLLPADTPADALAPLAEGCEQCAAALASDGHQEGDDPMPAYEILQGLSPQTRPVIVAMANSLARLSEGISQRQTVTGTPGEHKAKSLFVEDAFSNPAHVRFALKTTLAIMAAYVFYSAMDWQGISTSVTTCFFVALGSLGETLHKLTLRMAGALIGGLVAAICIVFIFPLMDDIGQLCLLVFAVAVPCAWVATSSARLSYAGMQIAFAFFMGVLHDYTPYADYPNAAELTVLRDRVAGILLGNLLMSLIFSVVWPVSANERARLSVAAVLRGLGQLLADKAHMRQGDRLTIARALGEARHFTGIAAFEPETLPTHTWQGQPEGVSLNSLDRLVGATFTVVNQVQPGHDWNEAITAQDEAASAWFVGYAERLTAGLPSTPLPGFDVALERHPTDLSLSHRIAHEARLLLHSEIENVLSVRA